MSNSETEKNEQAGKWEAFREMDGIEKMQASESKLETGAEGRFFEKPSTYERILSQIETTESYPKDQVAADAEMVYREQEAQKQVDYLVNLAFAKGLTYAVKVAKHLEDNYVLDKFHDRMIWDDLHAALVQRGIIKER